MIEFEKALEVDDQLVDALLGKGRCLSELGRVDEADEAYSQSKQLTQQQSLSAKKMAEKISKNFIIEQVRAISVEIYGGKQG